jgi:hypothetical protein
MKGTLAAWIAAGVGILSLGVAAPLWASTGCGKCDLQYTNTNPPTGQQCNGGSCASVGGDQCLQGGDWSTIYLCYCALNGTPVDPGANWCRTQNQSVGGGALSVVCIGGNDCAAPPCTPTRCNNGKWECQCP